MDGPPPTTSEYFLKVSSYPSSTSHSAPMSPSRYNDLYLRLHGNFGITAVMLTSAPPKFLRWHDEPTLGKQIAIPWKSPERNFGLCLKEEREGYGWEEVQINEGEASEGFQWEEDPKDEKECLVPNDADERDRVEHGGEKPYRGWMATDWCHGHPQLFWATGRIQKELPTFCERVRVVRECHAQPNIVLHVFHGHPNYHLPPPWASGKQREGNRVLIDFSERARDEWELGDGPSNN